MTTIDALTSLVRPAAVHRDIYKRSDIFELEMERIFKGTWVFVGHDSEVREPGDYRTMRIGREPVIFVRDSGTSTHCPMPACTPKPRGAGTC